MANKQKGRRTTSVMLHNCGTTVDASFIAQHGKIVRDVRIEWEETQKKGSWDFVTLSPEDVMQWARFFNSAALACASHKVRELEDLRSTLTMALEGKEEDDD